MFFLIAAICLNMIVKDESPIIERCLNSVKPLIDTWVIVDTGSSDGTQKKILECMEGIPGELHERPWVDFAHNRNEALALAKEKGDYLLFIDADEQLLFAPHFQKPALDKDCYFILCENQGTRYGRIQLIKSDLPWRWEGKVHETLECSQPTAPALFAGVINFISWDGSRSRDPQKYLKDAALLEQELRKDPTHKRNTFYLAKSYQDARQFEKALATYQKRIAMSPWDEEVQWSLYQIGALQEELAFPSSAIIHSYCVAFQACPTRAEPLYRLANFYNRCGQPLLAHLTSQFALTLPVPAAMFVEQWVYDAALLFEFAQASFGLGKRAEAKESYQKLLAKPNLPQEVRSIAEQNLLRLCADNR